jgi:hypothetical protein
VLNLMQGTRSDGAILHGYDYRLIKRSITVKISTTWGRGKTSRKGKRPALRTKIRWNLLGLDDPALAGTTSMEDIRRQISSMASRGFGPGTRSRSGVKEVSGQSESDSTTPIRKRRRGATE